jgi:hypothetical protein
MVAVFAMATPAERADEVEKTESGDIRRVVEAGSVACLVNRGRASIGVAQKRGALELAREVLPATE